MLQSRRMRGAAGEPLPVVFQTLNDAGTRFLRGQLVLVAAGPGTGKSAFTLTLALRSRATCLYFSADSDAFVQLTRSVSILTGMPLASAAELVLSDRLSEVTTALTGLPIRLNYEASPTLDRIETSIEAYEEVYGDYPDLIIVDNVTNVRSGMSEDDGDPFAGLEGLMDYLHTMARNTEACVIGLHHVTGPYNDSDKPIPLSGVKGQIARVPELVLTMHRRADDYGPDTLAVSTVKNRGGRMDASGMSFVELDFDTDRMLIRDRAA
ncbi:DnaB-like helicase C-terminal domain-containing protein [Actinocrispum wychmicini]|nr:DnaB-like helicase C-terminal domain-containing protein [Actinocrispum wychmicini]